MKKEKHNRITHSESTAADVPFFARRLGARPVRTDELAHVMGSDARRRERRAKHG